MHLCAFGDLVDHLLVRPQGNADDFCIIGRKLGKDSAVCCIMASRKHFLYVEAGLISRSSERR